MTEPSSVRMATPADAGGLLQLFRMSHAEDGLFSYSEEMVKERIDDALRKHDGIIGVIGNGELHGGIYLAINRTFYSKDFHLGELWNYVHPDHRKSRYALDLIEFAKRCSDEIALPLIAGVVTNDQTGAKARLYHRSLGNPIGAFFIHGAPAASKSDFWTALDDRSVSRGGRRVRRRRVRSGHNNITEAIRP